MGRPAGPRPCRDAGGVSPGIVRALCHIEERFTGPVTLRDLAEVADMDVSALIRQFKREVGRTPHRHLCLVRVRAAQDLLAAGLTPAAAALDAGFFDQSHLARHLKRHCGTTPGRYAAAVVAAPAAAA